jgi:hypothetical protein
MGKMRNAHNILVGELERERPLENLHVDGRIVLELISGNWGGKTWNWIHLAEDGDQWWAVVDTTMNLQAPLNAWDFLTS